MADGASASVRLAGRLQTARDSPPTCHVPPNSAYGRHSQQVVPESIASSTAANGASADSASTGLPVAAAPALAPAGEAPTAAPVVVAPPAAAEEPVEPSPSDTASPADADATKEAAAVGGAVSGEVPVVPAEVASTEIPAGAGADLAASCVPHAHHTPQHGGAAPAAATATAAGTAAVAAVTAATVVQAEPAAPAAEAVAPAAEPVVPAAPAASGGKVVTINAADLASDAISRSPTHSYTVRARLRETVGGRPVATAAPVY